MLIIFFFHDIVIILKLINGNNYNQKYFNFIIIMSLLLIIFYNFSNLNFNTKSFRNVYALEPNYHDDYGISSDFDINYQLIPMNI